MWDWSEAVDADRLPRPEAEDLGIGIQGAATAQARGDARLLELVGQFDAGAGWAWFEGITSCAHWLGWACSMSPGTAREHVRVARALRSMPRVAELFADGALTYSKVREVTRLVGRVEEGGLCELARAQTASQLARTVRSYRAHSGTHLGQVERRRLSWQETDDGMVTLSVRMLPEEAATVRGAVEAATDRHLDQPDDPLASDGDPADRPVIDPVAALCDVARGYLDGAPTTSVDDPNLVVVHVGLETLAGVALAPSEDVPAGTPPDPTAGSGSADLRASQAWIERGGPIEAATAARHACDGDVVGMIIDAEGDVLAMGRTRRFATPAQRRALRVRDGGCQFPGCQQRRRLKAHHIAFWANGGSTDLDNLLLLCQAHHTYVHEGGVEVTGRAGAWVFTLPDGRPISTGDAPDPDLVESILLDAAATAAEEPDRIFPPLAGEGFSLYECVQVLFDIELPSAA
ncbi:HNH endonuclease signature motif containing protein [Raineyella fluvialis]|nr:HNH endonuclease signature motif containing protein [Raineyella fluvialis]